MKKLFKQLFCDHNFIYKMTFTEIKKGKKTFYKKYKCSMCNKTRIIEI